MRRTTHPLRSVTLLRTVPPSVLAGRVNACGSSLLTSRGFASEPAGTKLKPDQPNPAWNDYAQLLNNFMEKLVHKQRLGYKWWVRPVPAQVIEDSASNYHFWFDEEKFPEGKTVVPVATYAPGKVERTLTINWKTWEMTIDHKDLSDHNRTTSRAIQIPPDWLLAMKKVRWPLLEEAQKNAQASVPATLPTVKGRDLYQVAKHKLATESELEYLKGQLMAIYV